MGSCILEVDAPQISGDDDNQDKVVWRHQDRCNHCDAASPEDSDAHSLAKHGGDPDPVVAFGPCDAVGPGKAVHDLRLEVEEGTLCFGVNGHLALQESEYRFGEGQIRLGCTLLLNQG